MVRDFFGREIKVGDIIYHPSLRTGRLYPFIGIVKKFNPRARWYKDKFSISVSRVHSQWTLIYDTETGQYKRDAKIIEKYDLCKLRTTVIQNYENCIILDKTIPELYESGMISENDYRIFNGEIIKVYR